jgi:cell division protein FtsA
MDNLIVVLDIGSAWTRVLAADVNEGVARYRGHGVVESAGMRKGLIGELGPASRAVRSASEQAERVARLNIAECAVGVGGPHIRGLNTNGGLGLGNRMREITREDVRGAVDRARAIALPADREILHLLPRQFILDDQPGIFDPVGMVGSRLEVDLHIATCSGSSMQSAVTCANRAGLEVSEVILESIAAAESSLSADERELGVCLLDIGAHSSDLVVFFEAPSRTPVQSPLAERTLPTILPSVYKCP